MAIKISVTVRKGGSGKTTTAVNLAAAEHLKGKRTLLVDLDPQCNATMEVGINPYELEKSIYTLLTDIEAKPQDVIIKTDFGLDILPATENLDLVQTGMQVTQSGYLKPILDAVDNDYDFIFIDTPPSKTMLAINALVASDYALIVMQTGYLAMQGLQQILGDIKSVKNGLNSKLEILGILPTMVNLNTNADKTVLQQVTDEYPNLILPFSIKYGVAFRDASLIGKPVVLYAPDHPGSQGYFNLADYINGRL